MPPSIQDSLFTHWLNSSDPSPSKARSVILRDRYGTQIRKIQVRNRTQIQTGNRIKHQTEKIEYEHVQLRFFCEMEHVIYEDWKIEFFD